MSPWRAAEQSDGPALSPDGQRIYLPQRFSRRVTVLAGGSFEEKITVPGFAYGVAFVPRPCVVDASPPSRGSRRSRATPAERPDHRPTHRHVADATKRAAVAHNGFFGNPTNGDIGLATTLHDPGNCFDANTDPAGLTTDPPDLQSPPYNPCGSANAGDSGPLAAEALCATQLLAPCPSLPGASYPRPDATFTLPAIPAEPGMANPCAGVPRNPCCP